MQLKQRPLQSQSTLPQTIQCRQLLLLPVFSLDTFLSKIVLDNPYLEMQYTGEDHPELCGGFPAAPDQPAFTEDVADPSTDGGALDLLDEIYRFEGMSLFDTLLFQAGLHDLTPDERKVVNRIIAGIDCAGYFTDDLEDVAVWTGCTLAQAEAMLALVQTFQPDGVGARTLAECLLLQVDPNAQDFELVRRIIREDLELLAAHRYDALKRKHHVDMPRLLAACDAIRALNPKPGAACSAERMVPYVYADASVHRNGTRLQLSVRGRPESLVRFDGNYMRGVQDPEALLYLRAKKSEALSLLNSLDMRYTAMCRLLGFLVREQRDFFLGGPVHLRPLSMKEAAVAIGMHPSTVSRCVNGKYLETPRGVYPLRFFFQSTSGSEELSAETARQLIAGMIEAEDKSDPVSDAKMAARLAAAGISVSRRTVTKYREQLGLGCQRARRHHY